MQTCLRAYTPGQSGEAGRGVAVAGTVLGSLGLAGFALLIILVTAGAMHSHRFN